MKPQILLLFIVLGISTEIFAQTKNKIQAPSLKLDLVLVDYPYQADAFKTNEKGGLISSFWLYPSMNQSLSLSKDLYSSAHYGLAKLFDVQDNYLETRYKPVHLVSLIVTDFVLSFVPLGDGWLHEEYHRAIMNRYHVDSYNNINRFPIGEDLVSVDHVKDEDLVHFKKESPYDFIRMHVAGIEGGYLLIDKLQKDNFFNNQHLTHEVLYLWITINNLDYVISSSAPDLVDEDTDASNIEETSISERDFTGWDFTGWAYDLFNPNENYENRGIHPSGIGIDRYIKTTDLNEDALQYLKKQGRLQLLNLISPMLFFKKSIKLNNKIRFNFALRHLLTSFGNDISLNVFLQKADKNWVFVYHQGSNYKSIFPAVELELRDYSFNFKNNRFFFSPRIILGLQPQNQSFLTKKADFLGYAGLRLDWSLNEHLRPWIETSLKTPGWISGNEFLGKNWGLRLGLSMQVK